MKLVDAIDKTLSQIDYILTQEKKESIIFIGIKSLIHGRCVIMVFLD